MVGEQLKRARAKLGWTQQQAAERLGVSQAYVCLMERNHRPVPQHVVERLADQAELPATLLPLRDDSERPFGAHEVAATLGALGYPGFAYLSNTSRPRNPAALLLQALSQPQLEPRATAALPWVVLTYADMDWGWLVERAKRYNLQNRLGFVVTLARELAQARNDADLAEHLEQWERTLDDARLAKEDTLCRPLTDAERRYLKEGRPTEARHWNLLTNLSLQDLQDVA